MPMTLAEWKWRFMTGLLEEIGKECSTQVLAKVMTEIWWNQAKKTKGNFKSVFEHRYAALSRWANDGDNSDEIASLMASLLEITPPGVSDDEEENKDLKNGKACLAILLLCSNPDRLYTFKVEVDHPKITKEGIIWEFCRNVENSHVHTQLVRKLMPMPPKDPDQMYCVLDNTIVGACNLFSMSERIQCMWDAKLSGCDMSIFKEKKC